MTDKQKEDPRTYVSLHDLGETVDMYARTDPRFNDRSECVRHLIRLGLEADKEARKEALDTIVV